MGGELGDGALGAGVVDEVEVMSGGSDDGVAGEVVEGAGQAEGGLVETSHGVVGEEGLGAAGEFEMMSEVADALAELEGLELEAGGDALVEAGEDAHLETAQEHGLAGEDEGEGVGRPCRRCRAGAAPRAGRVREGEPCRR